tara:strand:+ start:105 stop:755 length:651 start_codon:yes stop_codon:yes gene_type:complete
VIAEEDPLIEDLLLEKSLWQIFWKSPGVEATVFNLWVFLLVVFSLILFVVLLGCDLISTSVGGSVFVEIGLSVLEYSSSFGLTVLALLLAGFAVFSVLSNPYLLIPLASNSSDGSGSLSHLKKIFFLFLSTIVHLISYSSFAFFLKVFVWPFLLVDLKIETVGEMSGVDFYIVATTIVILGGWTTLLFLKLKSFVWNAYQLQLLVLVHEIDRQKED